MGKFTSQPFLLQGICLFTILQGITGENCTTPKVGPSQKITVTIWDSQNTFSRNMWSNLCKAVKDFPQGLISLDYKAGALATGSGDNMKCGGASCKADQTLQCMMVHSQHFLDCYNVTIVDDPSIQNCVRNGDMNETLLKNAALRAQLNIPENVIPTIVVNQTYDPCVKIGSYKYKTFLRYFCTVYQKNDGKCA